MFTDKISQRILASLLGISALVLTSAAFILILNTSFAAKAADNVEDGEIWDDGLRGAVGLGIHDGAGYFVVWGNPNLFYKVELEKAQDWYKEE